MRMHTYYKTTQNHRSIRSTREDRRQINRRTHPIPEDLHNADGVADSDCADVTNVQRETAIATSAI